MALSSQHLMHMRYHTHTYKKVTLLEEAHQRLSSHIFNLSIAMQGHVLHTQSVLAEQAHAS